MKWRALYRAGLVTGLAVIAAAPAGAQSANVLDQVVSQFQGQAAGWEGTLQSLALHTFGILALIDLAFAGFRLVFRGADASEWMAEIVNQVLFLGFFLALLENAATWGQAIVDSFRQAGKAASGVGVAPSDVFAAGVALGQKVLEHMSGWHPAAAAALMLAAIVILVCFALIAAWMVVTLVQSYIVIAAGVINMAFGGSRWTKDIAVSTVRYTLSVGAKLMMLQLLVSIGQNLITSWAANFTDLTNASLLVIIGSSIVLVAVVKILPDEFQKMVGGASLSSGSALVGAAAAVGGTTAAAAATMAGIAPMTGNAFRLASAQVGAKDAQAGDEAPQRSRISRAALLTGYAARNMAQAPFSDLGRRLSGQYSARHGISTWRMSADMANRRRLLKDDNGKPLPPPPPGAGGNTIS